MTIVVDLATKRAQSIVGTAKGRDAKDFYETPKSTIQALLDRESFTGKIWEPACGNGAICKVLAENGYTDILATDLYDYGYGSSGHDFLESHFVYPNIITNPPFNIAEDFMRKSLLAATDKVALFAKLSILEGVKRKELFTRAPLKTVYVFSKRQKLAREGETYKNGGMMAFCWLVFQHSYEGRPEIQWI